MKTSDNGINIKSSDSAATMVSNYATPSHYSGRNDITCDDAIKAALTKEEYRGWCKGNILKYTWREAKKGKDEDLLKCRNYVNFALHDR